MLIGGRDVTGEEPSKRGVAMVFQSYALYPHMTVAENMEFGLEMAKVPKAERVAAVEAAARTLRLSDYLDRKPRALSGGQRQRVAIGRAIVRKPSVFLFDEPLSNLDAELRVEMRLELARIHRDVGATMIHVTHDQLEAMTLADRIVVMNKGRVEQQGAPDALYSDPDSLFVAGFLGSPRMNFLKGRVTGREGDRALVEVPALGLEGLPVRLRVAGAGGERRGDRGAPARALRGRRRPSGPADGAGGREHGRGELPLHRHDARRGHRGRGAARAARGAGRGGGPRRAARCLPPLRSGWSAPLTGQCEISTGSVMSLKIPVVAPPRMNWRSREWPKPPMTRSCAPCACAPACSAAAISRPPRARSTASVS